MKTKVLSKEEEEEARIDEIEELLTLATLQKLGN